MSKLSVFLVLALAVSVPVRAAPTAAQIAACALTLVPVGGLDQEVFYSTTNTSNFQVTWTYDTVACTDAGVPIVSASLTNWGTETLLSCSVPSFTSSGSMVVTCPMTYGAIAQAAAAGDSDWTTDVGIGIRNVVLLRPEMAFTVTPYDPPVPSGSFQKRTRSYSNNLHCAKGQSWCRTNAKTFECHNTSSEVTACGACPYDDAAVDCTSIEGVNAVECKHSRCFVGSCVSGYQVAPDRQSCISHTRALVAQKYRR